MAADRSRPTLWFQLQRAARQLLSGTNRQPHQSSRRQSRTPRQTWQQAPSAWLAQWKGLLPTAATLLAAVLLSLLFFRWVNGRLLPILEAAASDQATALITAAIDRAADDCLIATGASYGDFVQLETGPDGRVTALTANTAASGRFRRLVSEAVLQELSTLEQTPIVIPLGSLSGEPLLSGFGPGVKVRLSGAGTVSAEYENAFAAAGMNQTHHQVILHISVHLDLFLPGEILPLSVQSAVPVAETVIVGETPDTYLNLQQQGATNTHGES